MKLSSSSWAKISQKFPHLFQYTAKRQSETNSGTLAGSVVEKETPAYKPLGLLTPALIILLIFTVFPFLFNFGSAFLEVDNVTDKIVFTTKQVSKLLSSADYAVGFRNSIIYGLILLPFNMTIALLISSLIATLIKKWAKGLWQTVFFLPYMTNAVAVSLAFIQFFAPSGLFNTAFNLGAYTWLESGDKYTYRALFPMFVQGVWSSMAFNILIFTTAMLSVDKNQYRSASIDGVGGIKQFFTITLPSIKSTTTFLITIGIINGTKLFPLALFNNRPEGAISNGGSSLMLFIYSQTEGGNYPLASASAISLLVIGLFYSFIIRGGFNSVTKMAFNLGEYNVWNRIKSSKEMIEFQAKKNKR
ncbi:carbohydrate ABC transporter permease [Mycoplasmopsis opalescens]|uniref:carbohydrate ABC transporter permease n=1 Tax=Mycoplasmopsis opalescens TaxID=114886 RepID=UPI0004A764D8|nr:sugar ABC transporter permease [Mycoplasmopsis opalescens]